MFTLPVCCFQSQGLAPMGSKLPSNAKPTNDEKRVPDQLKSKRNLLLKEYFKNPINTRLAIEIKLMDDCRAH